MVNTHSFLLDLRDLLNQYGAINPRLLKNMLYNRKYSESEIQKGVQLALSRHMITTNKDLELILND